jgi:hypothetical protein
MKWIVCIFGILIGQVSEAQEWVPSISYKYLYSSQLDKAVQTYNFSRPFLEEKQPLFIHGWQSGLTYFFRTEKKWHHGIACQYAQVRSRAENELFENKLALHLLQLGYALQYNNTERWPNIYLELQTSVIATILTKKVNTTHFTYDEEQTPAYGIGGNIAMRCGYKLPSKSSLQLIPFAQADCTPYHFAPNDETLINQTRALVTANWKGMFSVQIGVAVKFIQ